MALTYFEHTEFTDHTDEIVDRIIQDDKYSMLLFKVLTLSMRNSDALSRDWNETIFENRVEFRNQLVHLLHHAANEAYSVSKLNPVQVAHAQPDPPPIELKGYTTKHLAKFFGVSQTTINKWVQQKRFGGISRSYERENLYFSPDTTFTSPNGKQYQISEVAAMYETGRSENTHDKSERQVAEEQNEYYMKKYNGLYEETLGGRAGQWTPEEEMDAHTWTFYLEKLNIPRNSE